MNRRDAREGRSGEHGQDLVFAEDQDVLALEPDVRARVLSEQDLVAHLHVQGDLRPVVEDPAVADGEDLALLRLLLGRVGDDDPAPGRLLLLDAADDQTIVQRAYFHGVSSINAGPAAGCVPSRPAGYLPSRLPRLERRRTWRRRSSLSGRGSRWRRAGPPTRSATRAPARRDHPGPR